MTSHDRHAYSTEDLGDRWRRSCTCGFQTYAWEKRFHTIKATDSAGCPKDPAIRALATLQFSTGGLFDSKPVDDYAVHLVRSTNRGTPGATLCGIDRFAKEGPGWSVGGGISGGSIVHPACEGCVAAARAEFPGLPIVGSVGAVEMRVALAYAEAVGAR